MSQFNKNHIVHPWMKGIQGFTYNDHSNFKKKIMRVFVLPNQHLKTFSFRTDVPISSKLGMKHSWVMGILVWSNEGYHFQKGR